MSRDHLARTPLVTSTPSAAPRPPAPDTLANIVVIGLDNRGRAMFERLPRADACRFHQLFSATEIRGVEWFAVESWLDRAEVLLADLRDGVDGLVAYWDFPIAEMVAILAQRHNLHAATLEAVTRLQHKYWARLRQRRIVPEAVPAFEPVDVFDDAAVDTIGLAYPYWLKPVRSFRSHLGFRISCSSELHDAVATTRAELPRIADPYAPILARLSLPPEVAAAGAHACIAEAIIEGQQCTLEGWSQSGEVEIYGAIDSIRDANGSTFSRYQYPSSLPPRVLASMAKIARSVVLDAQYEDAPFNAEFFWEPDTDRIWLLEINARLSRSHLELFEHVDGVAHAQVLVDLALGRRPTMPRREGDWPLAAKCFIRHYRDALVRSVPDHDDIDRIRAAVPGTSSHLDVQAGDLLSALPDQDPYSHELGHVIVGATSEQELLDKFDRCVALLGLGLDLDERETR
jgi:biotin carboxylase